MVMYTMGLQTISIILLKEVTAKMSELTELTELSQTPNFDSALYKVFSRLINGEGPGLLVLWGGVPGEIKKANKGYFLNLVEIFQRGVKASESQFSEYVWNLLQQLEPDDYHCIRVIENSPLPKSSLYQTPLSVTLPLAIAGAVHRNGWVTGRKMVILCDNFQEFIRFNKQANEQYLRDLAPALDLQTDMTFIGASRMVGWDAESVLGSDRLVNLGWD